jgi:hypothetical protein
VTLTNITGKPTLQKQVLALLQLELIDKMDITELSFIGCDP